MAHYGKIELRLLFLCPLFPTRRIMQRLKEAMKFLSIPHYLSLPEWDQEDFIRIIQQRRREFRPKKKNDTEGGLDFAPPTITETQKEMLDGMVVGVQYSRVDLGGSVATLRALAGKGLVRGDREEEVWIRIESEWF